MGGWVGPVGTDEATGAPVGTGVGDLVGPVGTEEATGAPVGTGVGDLVGPVGLLVGFTDDATGATDATGCTEGADEAAATEVIKTFVAGIP